MSLENISPSRESNSITSTALAMGGTGAVHPRNASTSSLPPSIYHAAPPIHADSSNLHGPDPPGILDLSSGEGTVHENDIVIAVMGMTGAGKSSFINTAAGKPVVEIGHKLNSQTRAVQPVRLSDPDHRRNIVLVDTPGFDDSDISDTQVLKIIAHWLSETYRNSVKLSGILYLHRITDDRMGGTPLRNLSVFRDLCGDSNLKNIILVTTMWDEVDDQVDGPRREEELVSVFWKDMISIGSLSCRFQRTRTSAWRIIESLDLDGSSDERAPLQIQQEMVDRGQQFHETTAAKTLLRFLLQLVGEVKRGWAKLFSRNRRTDDPKRSLGAIPSRPLPNRSSTIRSNVSEGSWFVVSESSTSPTSSIRSLPSPCSTNGRRDALPVVITALKLAHQVANIGHIPMLRGIIGTVLHIAQLIEQMGGTHHAINQVVESSGWLLNEITRFSTGPKLTKGMRKTLDTLQRELKNLQQVVTMISKRGRFARFFLQDQDIAAIQACTSSIRAVYHKLEVKIAIENSQALARLEEHVTALGQNATLRQCECGISSFAHNGQENGQPIASTSQSP